jgi:hypothetical protein
MVLMNVKIIPKNLRYGMIMRTERKLKINVLNKRNIMKKQEAELSTFVEWSK